MFVSSLLLLCSAPLATAFAARNASPQYGIRPSPPNLLGRCSNDTLNTTGYPLTEWGQGLVQEPYCGGSGHAVSDNSSQLELVGNGRYYFMNDVKQHSWKDLSYIPLDLRGHTLSFDVDFSSVGCGCNAALYMVGMPLSGKDNSSGYCDIQGVGGSECIEIDLIEGNVKAIQSTLHSQQGQAYDGTCNQYGCGINWGKDDNQKYGKYAMIDSTQPYTLAASFDYGGHMNITLEQQGRKYLFWDVTMNMNGATHGVPEDASQKTADAMNNGGVVLVGALWSGDMAWLDGGCNGQYQRCDLNKTTAVFKNIRIDGRSPTPTPTPPTPTPTPPSPPSPPAPPSPACPGGSLAACITACPTVGYKACVDSCVASCTSTPPSPPTPPPASACDMYPGFDCYGNDLSSVAADTPQACCDICDKTSGCKAFTHKQADKWNPNKCYMKKSCNYRKQDSGVTAGVRN